MTTGRVDEMFAGDLDGLRRDTDRMFGILLVVQWLAQVVAAVVISPRAWDGGSSQIHPHVWAAVILGALVAAGPLVLIRTEPGGATTRHVVAAAQMLHSALLVHLTGGRIETHFHVFGSLAIVAFYRDVGVLLTATVVVAADHALRSFLWPMSVFGVPNPAWWRWLEHAAWVVFEDVFLVLNIRRGLREMATVAERRAELERELARRGSSEQALRGAAEGLARAGASIAKGTRALVGQLQAQASASAECAATSEAIARNAAEAMARADEVRETSARSLAAGVAGREAAQRSITAIRGAREQAARMSADVSGLTAQARSADAIVTSVDELADRVNLLAVNAAIEAARAGDHGLGFAVVAREIRSLADEAKRATREVRAILDQIGTSTGRAVALGAEVEQAVDAASGVVQEAGDVIQQLEDAIRAARLAADRISEATQHQAAGIQQVSNAVRGISKVAVESSGQVAVISDAAERVRSHSQDLEALRADRAEG